MMFDDLPEECTPELLDQLETVLDKLDLMRLCDRMLPLEGEQEQLFRADLEEFLGEACPISAKLLASVDFDLSRLDLAPLRQKIEAVRAHLAATQ